MTMGSLYKYYMNGLVAGTLSWMDRRGIHIRYYFLIHKWYVKVGQCSVGRRMETSHQTVQG